MQTITNGITGAQASAIISANDAENQVKDHTVRAYSQYERATVLINGVRYMFRSKINANNSVPSATDFTSAGSWELLGQAPLQIYATVAAANAARLVATRREGDIVAITGASGIYLYWWKGGTADANLVEVSELTAIRTTDGNYSITDAAGNVAFRIDAAGITSVAKFNDNTVRRVLGSDFFMVVEDTSLGGIGVFGLQDAAGNVCFNVSKQGLVDVAKFGGRTEDYIKNLVASSVPPVVHDLIYGKKVSILGDSISTDNGGGTAALTYPQQYWGQLATQQICTIFRNAIAGSTIAGTAGTTFATDSRWQSLDSVFVPDVILIFGGINDFLVNSTLGVLGDTVKTTFYGALDYLYKSIMARCPNTRVIHMTPLHTMYFPPSGGVIPEYNGVRYLTEYCNAIKEVAQRYGVSIIDTNQNSGISCYNIGTLSTDLIHPKTAGHQLIYKAIVHETNFLL